MHIPRKFKEKGENVELTFYFKNQLTLHPFLNTCFNFLNMFKDIIMIIIVIEVHIFVYGWWVCFLEEHHPMPIKRLIANSFGIFIFPFYNLFLNEMKVFEKYWYMSQTINILYNHSFSYGLNFLDLYMRMNSCYFATLRIDCIQFWNNLILINLSS